MIYRKDPNDPEKGYEWLAKLDANTKEYAQDPTNLYLKLARQEGLISLWNLQDILIQAHANNQPFDYVIPESGRSEERRVGKESKTEWTPVPQQENKQ